MEFRFWPISLLEKLNVWMLLAVLVMLLLIIDFVRKRRPRNFPPGPQLFPLVGTIVDLRQPLHLEMQKVRSSWTFLLLLILYIFSGFCHLSKAKRRLVLLCKLYNNNVGNYWVYPLPPSPLPKELDSFIRREFVPEESLHVPPFSSHFKTIILCFSPGRVWRLWVRMGEG